jgi:hypothetical protein
MAPYPPMPLISGSTTFSAAATATAASKALPPSARISSPAFVASGCAELTMPLVPTAGRVAVFRLAGPSTSSGSDSSRRAEVAGPVVCSSAEPPPGEVVSSTGAVSSTGVPSPEALSWTLD